MIFILAGLYRMGARSPMLLTAMVGAAVRKAAGSQATCPLTLTTIATRFTYISLWFMAFGRVGKGMATAIEEGRNAPQ